MSGIGTGSRFRLVGLALAGTMMLGGCGSATTTPTPSPSATSVPPAPTLTASPSTTPTPTPTPAVTPTPAQTASVPDWLKGNFDVAMGSTQPLTPAADFGRAAGTQIDDFGLDLIRQLDTKSNLCLSPTSIAVALAMVEPGARGTTATEIDKVLHGFGGDGDEAEVAALLAQLRSLTQYATADGIPLQPGDTPDPANPDPVVQLSLANEAFLQKGMNFEPDYLDALATGFDAGAGLLDFEGNPEAARQAINRWANDQTHGRIPQALGPGDITSDSRIALTNATYLKAAWASQFDPKLTENRAFSTASGAKRSVPTMAADENLSYLSTNDYQAVDLPYSIGTMSMTIVVPTDMASFVKSLTAAKLTDIWTSEEQHEVDLTLPRFSIDSRFELAPVLSTLGMPTAFTPGADLSGITTDEPLLISAVVHEANIDVVEDGTTAAAVTVVVGATTGGSPLLSKVQMHVDRPFLYFIHDEASGAVLFMGVVDDPSAK